MNPLAPQKYLKQFAVKARNTDFLSTYAPSLKSKVDVLYLDPPKRGRTQSHDQWMTKVTEVVQLAKPTLNKTGTIIASVQDSELPRLRLLLDDVFGEQNFIGMVTVDTGNVRNSVRFLSATHEYLLLYAKNLKELNKTKTKWRLKREGLDSLRRQERKLRKAYADDYESISSELKIWLKSQPLPSRLKAFYNADERGLYTYSDLSAPKSGAYYEVVNPHTGNQVVAPSRGWGVSEDTFYELVRKDEIIWGSNDTHQPLKKLYLKDEPDQVLRSVISFPQRSRSRLLTKILGPGFSNYEPKDLDYMKFILHHLTPNECIILDVYGGSGTTGHAVLDLNYENADSKRQFILVTWDEDGTFTHLMKPRLEAIISGTWYNQKQHRPRKAELLTSPDEIKL